MTDAHYPEEAGELVLHQLPELTPAQSVGVPLSGCVAVEHQNQRLHSLFKVRWHGCDASVSVCVCERQSERERI